MAVSGTVVAAWKDGTRAYLAVRVAEAGGPVEYIGSVALADLEGKTAAQQKALLVAAVKAARDAQGATFSGVAIAGPVTL